MWAADLWGRWPAVRIPHQPCACNHAKVRGGWGGDMCISINMIACGPRDSPSTESSAATKAIAFGPPAGNVGEFNAELARFTPAWFAPPRRAIAGQRREDVIRMPHGVCALDDNGQLEHGILFLRRHEVVDPVP